MSNTIELSTLQCKRCGHSWHPRKVVINICPKCKNKKWDSPKEVKNDKNI